MAAGEERQRRDAGEVERRRVGRQVGIVLDGDLQRRVGVGRRRQRRPRRARSGALHLQRVPVQAADHVEVEVGGELIERQRRLGGERRRAEQAGFLARPEHEGDVAPARAVLQLLRRGQHGGDTGRVVVGARMHLGLLAGAGERGSAAAVAEVIVVRAEHHPRLGDAGDGARRRAGIRRRCGSWRSGDVSFALTRHAARAERESRRRAGCRCRARPAPRCSVLPAAANSASATRRSTLAATMPEPAAAVSNVSGITSPRPDEFGPGHDQQRLGAGLTRGQRLVAERRIPDHLLALLALDLLRHVAQDEHDLVLHVEAGVAVVDEAAAVLGGNAQAVAGEDDGRRHLARVREAERGDGRRVGPALAPCRPRPRASARPTSPRP